MHILFAAGGTSGHINPAICIADKIKKIHPEATISFIGNETGMESVLVPKTGYDFFGIAVAGFQRKFSVANIKRNVDAFTKMFTSSKTAEKLLADLKPDVVVGTGGYASGPVVRKAAKMGMKTLIHEQNAYPGVTTKMLCGYVDTVCIASPVAKTHLKNTREYVFTGNPVRADLYTTSKKDARKRFGLDNRIMIVSSGGSNGAAKINRAMTELIEWNVKNENYYIYHSYGKFDNGEMQNKLAGMIGDNIRLREYNDDMCDLMAAADLIIGRAGALTIAELRAAGKASILIPSPNVAENHQYYNAMALAKSGAAVVIKDAELDGKRLISEVKKIIENKNNLKKMSQNAGKGAILDAETKIYDEIMKLYKMRK